MLTKRIILIGVISLVITLMSPLFFHSYFEEKPDIVKQAIAFGGPFPFAEQMVILPSDTDSYPIEVKFESPFETETKYKVAPLLFSFLGYFLFLFALYSIIRRLFSGKPLKEPE